MGGGGKNPGSERHVEVGDNKSSHSFRMFLLCP